MDLEKLIKDKRRQMTIWISFRDVFELELIYTDRRQLERMLERCKKRIWKNHQETEELDDALFNRQLATRINDWRGLNLGKLSQLTNIDINGDDPATEIPASNGNKIVMLEEIYGLNTFVRDTIVDIQAFRQKQLEAEIKNSLTSQDRDTD